MLSRWLSRGLTFGLTLMLVACASRLPASQVALPSLQLAPAALGETVALQQRLRFRFGQQVREMDALLEVDPVQVRLLVQAMGQTGVRLFWDGTKLQQQRAAWLPSSVRAERVLDDLQFALWPVSVIQQALPPAWTVVEHGAQRELQHAGKTWLRLTRQDAQRVLLENLAEGYALEIDSAGSAQGNAEDGTP